MFEKEHPLPNSHFGAHVKGVPHSLVPLLEKSKNHLWVMSLSKEQSCQDRFCDCCHGFQRWPDRTVKDSWFRGMVRVHKQHSMVNTEYPLLIDILLIVVHGFFIVNSDHIYMTLPLQQLFLFVSSPWEKIGNCCLFYLFQLCFALVGSRGPFIPVAVKWAFLQPIEIVEGLNIPKAQVKLKHTTGHSEA